MITEDFKEKYCLNFFTTVFGRHRMFVLPYITSALLSNEKAIAEIIVDNPTMIRKVHRDFLNKYFEGRWCIRGIPKQFKNKWNHTKKMKSIRWLTIPTYRTAYTYIGDIDIIILDKDIHTGHIAHAQKMKKPYSNYVRPNGQNMTGLHFVITKPYYKVLNKAYMNKKINKIKNGSMLMKGLDERLLCRMVLPAFGGPTGVPYRPGHGMHLSLGRPIIKWSAGLNYPKIYDANLRNHPVWVEGQQQVFDKRFMLCLKKLDEAIKIKEEDTLLGIQIQKGNLRGEALIKAKKRRRNLRNRRIKFK